jgi:hypothetical protein
MRDNFILFVPLASPVIDLQEYLQAMSRSVAIKRRDGLEFTSNHDNNKDLHQNINHRLPKAPTICASSSDMNKSW